MIVIDIGCARYGNDYSIERLIEWFKPDVLYGFDPNDAIRESTADLREASEKTTVLLSQQAAWIYDGEIGYRADGLGSWVTHDEDAAKVRCFDLAKFITELPADDIVLKLDCEGAEFELLEHLIATGTDARLTRILVEWHPRGEGKRRHAIEMRLSCPVEQWRW